MTRTEALVALAKSEGFITTRQALLMGVSYRMLTRLVAEGVLVRPVRCVYLPGVEADEHAPEQKHALLTQGLLSEHPEWVASHHSALALSGVPLWDVPLGVIHVAGPQRSSVIRSSVHLHVLRKGDPVGEIKGHRVLTPGFAALQVAATFGVPAGIVAADACLARRLTTSDTLARLGASERWRRGRVAVRRVVDLADGRAESPMESLVRLHLSDGDWTLEPQAPLAGPGAGYRADLLVDGRVVVEYDGEGKYAGPGGHQALLDEKAREDRIRAEGYGFVRVGRYQIGRPAALRRAVAKALADLKTHNAVPYPERGNFPRSG